MPRFFSSSVTNPPAFATIQQRLVLSKHSNRSIESNQYLSCQQGQRIVSDDGHIRLPLNGRLSSGLNRP